MWTGNILWLQVEYTQAGQPFAAMVNNQTLVSLYEHNISLLQTNQVPSAKGGHYGSTDMGNVSQVVPSIRPIFFFGSDEANHTRGFARDAGMSGHNDKVIFMLLNMS